MPLADAPVIDFLPSNFEAGVRNGRATTTSSARTCRSTRSFPTIRTSPMTCASRSPKWPTRRFLRAVGGLRQEHRGRLRPHRRPQRGLCRQPADGVLAACSSQREHASRKAARFVRFCDGFNIPIVTTSTCGIVARHRAGAGRLDQARREAVVRLFAGDVPLVSPS